MEENRKWSEEALPETQAQEPEETLQDGAGEAMSEAALEARLSALRAELEGSVREALNEALRVAGMAPEERASYEAQSREQALMAREQALLRREARADVLEQLAAKGLPATLADAVRCDAPEEARASVEALDSAFRQAVQEAVEARLKGGAPVAGASAQDGGDELDDESYYRMLSAKR